MEWENSILVVGLEQVSEPVKELLADLIFTREFEKHLTEDT